MRGIAAVEFAQRNPLAHIADDARIRGILEPILQYEYGCVSLLSGLVEGYVHPSCESGVVLLDTTPVYLEARRKGPRRDHLVRDEGRVADDIVRRLLVASHDPVHRDRDGRGTSRVEVSTNDDP